MSFWLLSDCQDWGKGGVYYNRLHIEHVNPPPGGLQPEPKGGCSLKRCAQVLGEGAEESEVCSIIFQCKCCLMTLFMCATKCPVSSFPITLDSTVECK